VGYGQMVAPFVTSSSSALLALALLPDASRADLNWIVWALRAASLHVVLLGGLLVFIVWRYADRDSGDLAPPRAAFGVQRAILGPPSSQERICGAVTVGLLMGFATQPLHGVDPAWVAVIAFVAMAAANVLTLDMLRSVNWNTVLLLGVFASMADVLSSAQLDKWLAAVTVSAVGGLGDQPLLFVAALAVACIGLSLVLRWQAAVPLLVIALAPVSTAAGIDPWIVAIGTLTASNMFFLPYQSTIYLALYTGGGSRLFSHAQARPVAFAYAVLTVVGLVASVPIWHVLGLL
jgi:DASS family divalent anion:Na+ symporter